MTAGEPNNPTDRDELEGAILLPDNATAEMPDSVTLGRLSLRTDRATDAIPPTDSAHAAGCPPGYELVRELGRGGMGVVYEARQRGLSRPCALKVILAGSHAGGDELKRFQTEAESIARLSHAHIVQVYEVGAVEGRPFLALELCRGGSLERKLSGTPLQPDEAAEVIRKLALAMQVAHQAQVIHRDLKPANVLLTADGEPKVTDFGLAKKLDEVGQTQTGAVMGTPSYMAPEQAQGKKTVGPLSDVYALGAILYECLTGRPPFRAATSVDTIVQVVTQEPVPLTQFNAKVPRDLETITLKCLQKEPARRYDSARQLADDLGRFLEGKAILARPVGTLERTVKWVRRNKAVTALATLVFVLLIVGTGAAWTLALRATKETERAEEAVQDALFQKGEAEKREGEARFAQQKAEFLVYASRIRDAQTEIERGRRDIAQDILLRNRSPLSAWEHGYLLRKTSSLWGGVHPDFVTCVTFSGDDTRIVSGDSKGTLKVWNAATGQALQTIQEPQSSVSTVACNRDGTQFVVANSKILKGKAEGEIKMWDARSGRNTLTINESTERVTHLAISMDGKHIVAVFYQTAKVWDASTGQEKWSLRQVRQGRTHLTISSDGNFIVGGHYDGTVTAWDVSNGTELVTLKGHVGAVARVAISRDNKQIYSLGRDNSAIVFDVTSGQKLKTITGITSDSVSLSNGGIRLLLDGQWRDAVTGQAVVTIKALEGFNTVSSTSSDGTRMVSGSSRVVRVWDTALEQKSLRLSGHTRNVNSIVVSADGQQVITGSRDNTVKVWNSATGELLTTLRGRQNEVQCVAMSGDGQFIAAGREGSHPVYAIDVWEVKTARLVLSLKEHLAAVTGVVFSSDGKRLVSSSKDRTVRVWDAQSGQLVTTIQANTRIVNGVALNRAGSRIVSGSEAGEIAIWDTSTGREWLTIKNAHQGNVFSVVVTSDDKRIISGGEDGTVRIWDATTGEGIATLKGHLGAVTSVDVSQDGKRIVSACGSSDKTGGVKVWDAITGQEALSLNDHRGRVNSVAFSRDGRHIVSASGDANNLGEVLVRDAGVVQQNQSSR